MAKPDSSAAHMALTLGGDSIILTDVSVDTAQPEVAPTSGPDVLSRKTPTISLTKAEFSFNVAALEGAADLSDWITKFVKGFSGSASNLVFSHLDAKYKVTARVELLKARITEVRFPTFDAASKDFVKLTLKVAAGQVKWLAGDGKQVTGTRAYKNLLSSNFRVEIDGLPTEYVTKVESMTFRRGGWPNLVMNVSTKDFEPFSEWVNASVIMGSTSSSKQGSLAVMDATLSKSKLDLSFFDLLPTGLRSSGLGFEVRVNVGRVSFKYR